MARSEHAPRMRPKIRLQSDQLMPRSTRGRGHDAPRASRPRRLRRCAARSLDPCSRRGLTAPMRRRTPSSHTDERTIYLIDFLFDGGVQIRRLDGIEDSILPNRPPAVLSNATGGSGKHLANGPAANAVNQPSFGAVSQPSVRSFSSLSSRSARP